KPDRDPGLSPQDERVRDARLGLREGMRTRILEVSGRAEWPPAEGEVAIEVDAMGVLPGPGRDSVGIEVLDHDNQRLRGWGGGRQPLRDRHTGALVPMDVTDHEH